MSTNNSKTKKNVSKGAPNGSGAQSKASVTGGESKHKLHPKMLWSNFIDHIGPSIGKQHHWAGQIIRTVTLPIPRTPAEMTCELYIERANAEFIEDEDEEGSCGQSKICTCYV